MLYLAPRAADGGSGCSKRCRRRSGVRAGGDRHPRRADRRTTSCCTPMPRVADATERASYDEVNALLDAVQQLALRAGADAGRRVAVNVVWLLARTTVKASIDAERSPATLAAADGRRTPTMSAKPAQRRAGAAGASPRALVTLFSASVARMITPRAAVVAFQHQLELLGPRVGDAVARVDRLPAVAVERVLGLLHRRILVAHVEQRRSCGCRRDGRPSTVHDRRHVVDVERRAFHRAGERRASAEFDGASDATTCTRSGRSAPMSYPTRGSDRSSAALQRLPGRLAFAAVEHVVEQLVAVVVLGPPDERQQPLLIGAAAERRRVGDRAAGRVLRAARRSGVSPSKPAISGSPVGNGRWNTVPGG